MKAQSLILFAGVAASGVFADQPRYAQCGGRTYSGPSQCQPGLDCVFVSDAYYQCLAPGESPQVQQTTISPPPGTTSSPNNGNPGPYEQCGGSGYTGRTQCQTGLHCLPVDDFYSLCQYPKITVTSTVFMTGNPTSTQGSKPTTSSGSGSGSVSPYLDQCHGQAWKGPTRCADGLVCVILNKWYGQCLQPGQEIKPPR